MNNVVDYSRMMITVTTSTDIRLRLVAGDGANSSPRYPSLEYTSFEVSAVDGGHLFRGIYTDHQWRQRKRMPSSELTAGGSVVFGEISVEDLKQIFLGWDSRFGFVCRIDMEVVGICGEILPAVPEWLLEICRKSPFMGGAKLWQTPPEMYL